MALPNTFFTDLNLCNLGKVEVAISVQVQPEYLGTGAVYEGRTYGSVRGTIKVVIPSLLPYSIESFAYIVFTGQPQYILAGYRG